MFWSPRLPFTQLVSTKTSGCAYCAMQRSSGGSEVVRCYITCANDYSDTHFRMDRTRRSELARFLLGRVPFRFLSFLLFPALFAARDRKSVGVGKVGMFL